VSEVSDVDETVIRVLRGEPTDEEVAALVAVLAGASGGGAQPGPTENSRWGLPVDKLRYAISNYQRVTLQERMHMHR
jgi:Acyl-CoA carboxylase epsilon subunit